MSSVSKKKTYKLFEHISTSLRIHATFTTLFSLDILRRNYVFCWTDLGKISTATALDREEKVAFAD